MVLGAAIVFGPVVWLVRRWREAVVRDPATAPGAQWLGEQLSAHPYATGGTLLFGLALSGGLVMLVLVSVARYLADRFTNRARSGRRRMRG